MKRVQSVAIPNLVPAKKADPVQTYPGWVGVPL